MDWTTRFLFSVILFLSVIASAYGQERAPTCGPTQVITDKLSGKWEEVPITTGVSPKGALVETWANIKTSTWTILAHFPDGRTCLIASGDGFRQHKPLGKGLGVEKDLL